MSKYGEKSIIRTDIVFNAELSTAICNSYIPENSKYSL